MQTEPANDLPTTGSDPRAPHRPKFNWLLFLGALFAPSAVTSLVVLTGYNGGNTAPSVAMLGGLVGGIAAGIILGNRVGRSQGARVGLSVLFALVFSGVSVTMNMFGCLASGYNLNLH